MEGKALTCFQTQNMAKSSSFTELAKEFVIEHTKSGLKHDVLLQIHEFKQKSDWYVRDRANQLRQYLLAICPKKEMLRQERSVSIFLKGLINTNFYVALYMKLQKNLN